MRRKFAATVSQSVKESKRIYVLLGDIGVANFEEMILDYPKQVLNVGIMEQGMLSIAAGISRAGDYPIVHTIAPFLVERGYEQLKIDFSYNRGSGLIVTVGGSFDYSRLGRTHHCPNDVMLVTLLGGFVIYLPGSPAEVEDQIRESIQENALGYMRLGITEHTLDLEIVGGICKLKAGKSGLLLIVGTMLGYTQPLLSEFDFDCYYINSFSSNLKEIPFSLYENMVVLEDVTKGSTVFALEALGCELPEQIHSIGLPVINLLDYGTHDELMAQSGLSHKQILKSISDLIGEIE
jgi:transketolase